MEKLMPFIAFKSISNNILKQNFKISSSHSNKFYCIHSVEASLKLGSIKGIFAKKTYDPPSRYFQVPVIATSLANAALSNIFRI